MWTPLSITTHYDLSGSNITIEKMMNEAKNLHLSSLVITDRKTSAHVKFYKECLKNDIKPIFGLLAKTRVLNEDVSTIYIYAKNNEGYKSLLQIASNKDEFVDFSLISKHSKNLYIIFDTYHSSISYYFINGLKTEFASYMKKVEVSLTYAYFSTYNDKLDEYFNKKKRLIILDHVRYCNENDYKIYDTLCKIWNKDNDLVDGCEYHFRSTYTDNHVVRRNIESILYNCHVDFDFNTLHLPKYDVSGNKKTLLKELAFKGLERRLKGKKVIKKRYLERLEYELSVIDQMGYNDYILIVYDFVKYAKKQGVIVGPGRGSAAASLVSYCLGITNVDSVKYGLLFERFLNPERITMPDIDIDLPDNKREDIIKYVYDKYGKDKVASIITFGTFKERSALRDTARILNIDDVTLSEGLNRITSYSSILEMARKDEQIKRSIKQDPNIYDFYYIASQIEGLNRHESTHAAGIIVSSIPLNNVVGLQQGINSMTQTQLEMDDLESLGLLKIDFLGLSNLTVISNILDQIKRNNKEVLNIYNVPLDNNKTIDLLNKAEVTGIFQLESDGMRQLIQNMDMKSFDDIVAVSALYRPGPMEQIPYYLDVRHGRKKAVYDHAILESILKKTHGVIIYQEQILKILKDFAGYSYGEADVLRRAVSKKKESVLQKERFNFVEKSLQQGHSSELSNKVYDYIVKFASYGFNEAHSVSYAMISYWLLYLKANYPAYFLNELISSVISSESKLRSYIYEASKLGIKVISPSINKSTTMFVIDNNNLLYPLTAIKNIGISTANAVLEERKKGLFISYEDFTQRMSSTLNKRTLEAFIYSGALDEFKYTKKTMINNLDRINQYSTYGKYLDLLDIKIDDVEEFEFRELQIREVNYLGINLKYNRLVLYKQFILDHKYMVTSNIKDKHIKNKVFVVGVLERYKLITTKKDEEMALITISDGFRLLDGVVFPSDFKRLEDHLIEKDVLLFEGVVDQRKEQLQLVISNVSSIAL